MIVDEDYTAFMGKTSKKRLDILFFNLINESECDYLTLAIKIHLKKLETTLAWTKSADIRKFSI